MCQGRKSNASIAGGGALRERKENDWEIFSAQMLNSVVEKVIPTLTVCVGPQRNNDTVISLLEEAALTLLTARLKEDRFDLDLRIEVYFNCHYCYLHISCIILTFDKRIIYFIVLSKCNTCQASGSLQ